MIIRKETGLNIFHNKQNENSHKRVLPGQFVIHLRSFQGGFAHSNFEGITSPAYTVFDLKQKQFHSDIFWKIIFSSTRFIKQLELVTYGIRDGKSIKYDDFLQLILSFPNKEEQNKLAQIFILLNKALTLHQRYKDEQIFKELNYPYCITNAWEQRKLVDLAQRITRKNNNLITNLPLTISAEYGLVDQITYFNNRVASTNLKNYYLILNGEFAYNKSSSDGNPVGVIKRLDLYKNGALSILYIIFSIKDKSIINSDFLSVFFETSLWHKDIFERAAEGARNHGLLNISAQDFMEMNIQFPSQSQEQIKIKTLLNKLNTLITLHQRKFLTRFFPK